MIRTFKDAADSYAAQGGEIKYLGPVLSRWSHRDVMTIFPADVRALALEIYPSAKNSTRNRHVLAPLRAIMYHAHERGWCPALRIRAFRLTSPRRHAPPDEEWLKKFLARSDSDGLTHLSAIVLFMNHTGARISEAIALKWQDVDFEEKTALLVKTKTDRNSIRRLSRELLFRLKVLPRSSERVFNYTCRHSVNERLKVLSERAGIRYISCHYVGRGAFATNAINMGLDIKTAMIAGGWRTARLFLEVYAHPSNAGLRMASKIDEHYPKRERDWIQL